MLTRTNISITISIPRLLAMITYHVLVIVLMLVFVYFGAIKLAALAQFRAGIEDSPLLPIWSAPFLSIALPGICLANVIVLLFGFLYPGTQLLGLRMYRSLMMVFTLFILAILTIAPYVPCTCLGLNGGWAWWVHLLVNTGIILLTGLAIWLHHKCIVAAIGNEHSEHP